MHFGRKNQYSLAPGFMHGNFEIFDLKCKNSTRFYKNLMGLICGVRQRRKSFFILQMQIMRFKSFRGKINTLCLYTPRFWGLGETFLGDLTPKPLPLPYGPGHRQGVRGF
jgi:hypothetical protein